MLAPELLQLGCGGVLKIFEQKDDKLNQLMNYKGVCKTAPATPGLLTRAFEYINLSIFKGTSYHGVLKGTCYIGISHFVKH